ncbi:nucleotide exchange factor GrpE [Euhalothece natronophila Z-M001]|uniref:Nucleotide exchange factor GrpE n=1 Tax=Euhalothece natronophila Z-M001 TaxID=522448 RepID=A0A5B8NQG1_9CHRO|nr:nucleotide exchange factor GrpE [Euhalothece natronophila]QDZ41274.1 nucleotide exchange factor GrpE [Euhalothece natronophila Z-M001]
MSSEQELFWSSWLFLLAAIIGILWLQDQWSKPTENSKASPSTSPDTEDFKEECQRLRKQLETQRETVKEEIQQVTFEQLQSLLTQFPSARKMAEAKPNLPASNFSALFTPLENLLEEWEITPIGEVWQQVEFDPQSHQADSEEIEVGEKVYVRFVGYRQGEKILVPAKVSRTLPAGVVES